MRTFWFSIKLRLYNKAVESAQSVLLFPLNTVNGARMNGEQTEVKYSVKGCGPEPGNYNKLFRFLEMQGTGTIPQ